LRRLGLALTNCSSRAVFVKVMGIALGMSVVLGAGMLADSPELATCCAIKARTAFVRRWPTMRGTDPAGLSEVEKTLNHALSQSADAA
jgi:hypothetical protein